ncbi:MAG: hypothetical protein ACI9KK_002534, partial [Ascidiaceihabitans sp.]
MAAVRDEAAFRSICEFLTILTNPPTLRAESRPSLRVQSVSLSHEEA